MKHKMILLLLLPIFLVACAKTSMNPKKLMVDGDQELFDVTGDVLWRGAKPIDYPIGTAAYDGVCGKVKKKDPLRLKNKRLWHEQIEDVAVWLEPVWEDMSPEDIENVSMHAPARSAEAYAIKESECNYVPRLSVVPVGSRIEVVNEDRLDHWLIVEGKNKKREQFVQLYGETPPVLTVKTPGVVHVPLGSPIELIASSVDKWKLTSGFYRWMQGWVFVTDKKWFSSVGDNGSFVINNVPRGVYQVHTWHPLLGESFSVIRVPDDLNKKLKVYYDETFPIRPILDSTVIPTKKEVLEQRGLTKDKNDEF